MKRVVMLVGLVSILLLGLALPIAAGKPRCSTIQSGLIVYPEDHYWAGETVGRGYDDYGFNYTARRFSGWYVNSYLGFWGLPPYEGDYQAYIAANPDATALGDPEDPTSFWALKDLELDIKWNDAYRSRTDCDGDDWFDRHAGYDTYIGSGAWYTNHVNGTFAGEEWHTFSKVVAVPDDAELVDGFWYTANGQEIGYAVEDETEGMAGTFDLVMGQGFLYKGMPGLGRW